MGDDVEGTGEIMPAPLVLTLSGSVRAGSMNERLALLATERLNGLGVETRYVDLRDYRMVLFDPDLEASEGPPPAARDLCAVLTQATGFVIASPEYNGAMTPLLKNTVYWVSRVDLTVLMGKHVALMSATQGRGGGRNGLNIISIWLSYILVQVHPEQFPLARARDELTSGDLVGETSERFDAFLSGFATAIQ